MACTQPLKKRRFSREPDLEVLVEDEVFHVHSHDLMSASCVFCVMLETDMKESNDGQISLFGKKKDEFRELLDHIAIKNGAAPPDITDKNVGVLLRWSDEYQIIGLKQRCDAYLRHCLQQRRAMSPGVVESLELALTFHLEDLEKMAVARIVAQVSDFGEDVLKFADRPDVMKEFLPALYKHAHLEPPEELPSGPLEAKHLWPLVMRATEIMADWDSFEEYKKRANVFKSLEESVVGNIPYHYGRAVSIEELEKNLTSHLHDAIQVVVEDLQAKRTIRKTPGSSSYYRKYKL